MDIHLPPSATHGSLQVGLGEVNASGEAGCRNRLPVPARPSIVVGQSAIANYWCPTRPNVEGVVRQSQCFSIPIVE